MNIKLKGILLCFLLPLSSKADIQYEPLSSPKRHELFFGTALVPFETKWNRIFRAFSFQHNVLLREADQALGESYRDIFIPGIQWGLGFFRYEKSSQDSNARNYGACANSNSLSGQLALSLSLFHKFFLRPFGAAGMSGTLCFLKSLSKIQEEKPVFSPYLSYGLFLSLKIFDRGAVYSLDQDYGLNDIGIKGECVQNFYSSNGGSGNKTRNGVVKFCLLGLQFVF